MTTLITAAKETSYRSDKDWNQISERSVFRENVGLVGVPILAGSQTWFQESHSHSKTRVGSQRTRLGYKRKDQPITNPCSVKGKLRKNALCYNKSGADDHGLLVLHC